MTAPRRLRKFRSSLLLAAAIALTMAPIAALQGSPGERVVVDLYSGAAISGFDPVAYFVERSAVPGQAAFEYPFAGAVWRFRNQGNRAAFAADPGVYMPRFGGYDPVGVARGVPVPGDPRLWLIVDERLYLFFTPDARDTFSRDAERLIPAADRHWPQVQSTLAP